MLLPVMGRQNYPQANGGGWSYGMRPSHWAGAPPPAPSPPPYVEQQKATTIRNDINLKKDTLRLERDENDPDRYLVAFTFDSTVSGSDALWKACGKLVEQSHKTSWKTQEAVHHGKPMEQSRKSRNGSHGLKPRIRAENISVAEEQSREHFRSQS